MAEPRTTLPHGIYPYVVSPVDARGRVDQELLERLVDDLVATGIDGVTPLGSTGEVMYLTPRQRRDVVAATVRAVDGRVPVVPAVAGFSTHDAVAQATELEALGVDGLVAMRQQAFATSEAGVVGYFTAVARAVSLPLVIYTNPALLGDDLSVDALAQLAEVETIKYLKDAGGDTGRILSVLNRVGDRLEVFSASRHVPLLVLLLGGVGWMAGPACVVPEASVELYRRFSAGRLDDALALQRQLWPINELFRTYPLGACIKAALELRGYAAGDPIAPQQPLDAAARERLAQALRLADEAIGR